ncbi:hypothetical protein TanjilG_31654 [Lupinus angustifolius]|uniref:HMG box domain-containing protein n=2 Tax=Lupinus angustifolius TaxID=3871 RepID=A0A1J7HQV9_LUPAN|nr:hypothetical protein TanjilG_31654 [Lupinus angustifolius]
MPKASCDAKPADTRLKRKGAGIAREQTKKAAKDPNKPKRLQSAFFVVMAEFREEFKKENPNNQSVTTIGKACGSEWKEMNDAEKAPYVAKAVKKKEEIGEDGFVTMSLSIVSTPCQHGTRMSRVRRKREMHRLRMKPTRIDLQRMEGEGHPCQHWNSSQP